MTECMSCNPGNTPNLQGASLVGVGVVVVVLDPPRLEGVDQRRERQRPHDVLQQLVLAEAAVPGVVAHHKPLRTQTTESDAVRRRCAARRQQLTMYTLQHATFTIRCMRSWPASIDRLKRRCTEVGRR